MAPTITRTAIVDDDGTLTTGTVVNNAWKQELYDQIDAVVAAEDVTVTTVPHGGTGVATLAAHGVVVGNGASAVNVTGTGTAGQILTSNGAAADPTFQNPAGAGVSTVTTTGNITALALPAGSGDLVIYMNNATLATIQGITAGASGQRLSIISIGAGQVDLAHQNASATAANRLINFATSGNTSLAAGTGAADFEYDTTNSRWRLIAHEQGAWIAFTPTLSGTGATYATQSGAYLLRGRMVTVNGYIALTAKGTSIGLITGLPFTAAAAPNYNAATIGQMNNMTTTWVSLNGYVGASTANLQLIGRTAASTTVTTVGNADLSNTTDCMFAATYPV
jgi:hypothetical protein